MEPPEVQWRPADPLDPAEKVMLEHVAKGELFDGIDDHPSPALETRSSELQRASIRAAVLRHLLTSADWAVDPKGVRLRRVRIRGLLDLEAVTVRCSLRLEDCDLDDSAPVVLRSATIPLLVLTSCRLAGISADSITIAGNLNLNRSVISGPVILTGARIGGALLGIGTRIGLNSDGNTLICNGMNVRLSVHLSHGFTGDGAVVLRRVDIGGDLRFQDARLDRNSHGISVYGDGIRVGGTVSLDGDFKATGAVQLNQARIGGWLSCGGASIGVNSGGDSLLCDGIRTGGSVHLDKTPGGTHFRSMGAVRLAGAEVTGSLTCRGASLGANSNGNALIADELKVGVAVLLEDGFAASGTIRLPGADIRGQLLCTGSRINGSDADGYSLVGDGVTIGGPAHLDAGFEALGGVLLSGASVGGQLSFAGARLGASDAAHDALTGDGVRIGRDLVLDDMACGGGIRLAGAVIDGTLSGRGATLDVDQQQHSIAAGRLAVGGDVILESMSASGAAVLAGATIGGLLSFRAAQIGTNVYGSALNGNGIRVGRDVLLNAAQDGTAFIASGIVRLAGAEIAGSLNCQGAKLDGKGAAGALAGDGVKVGGSIYLTGQFTADGLINLSQANIGGSLHCSGAKLGGDSGQGGLFADQVNIAGGLFMDGGFAVTGNVSLRGASIQRELRWEPAVPMLGEVNLEGASAQYLIDDWSAPRVGGFWPLGRLRMVGFTYSAFGGGHQATAEQRLDWVRSQYENQPVSSRTGNDPPETPNVGTGNDKSAQVSPLAHSSQTGQAAAPPFATQPYKQLADVYSRVGQEDDARMVEIAMRRDLRRYGNLAWHRKTLNRILDVTIRYGYQTGRALVAIVALYLAVFLAFWFAQHQGDLIAAVDVNNPSLHPTALQCVSGYPCFYPAAYAFDLVVPIINIRQADFWQANGHHWFGWIWVLGAWIATASGWFLATLLVVGYSGLARR